MVVWRLTRKAHADQPLSGEGARRYGGRWNHTGVAVVYASQSLALAVLEYLVNLPISDLTGDLVSIQIEMPGNLPRTEVHVKDLPGNWRAFPSPEELKDIGANWVIAATTPLLVVPSVVIPNEHNYLINPKHLLSAGINAFSIEPFSFDTRLTRSPKPARTAGRRFTK